VTPDIVTSQFSPHCLNQSNPQSQRVTSNSNATSRISVKQTKTLNIKEEFSAYRPRRSPRLQRVGNFVDRGVSKRIPPVTDFYDISVFFAAPDCVKTLFMVREPHHERVVGVSKIKYLTVALSPVEGLLMSFHTVWRAERFSTPFLNGYLLPTARGCGPTARGRGLVARGSGLTTADCERGPTSVCARGPITRRDRGWIGTDRSGMTTPHA
jgi:hypothetical protein